MNANQATDNRKELSEITGILCKMPADLTDDELSQEMSECRISLESIRPYRFRQLEIRLAELRQEWGNRAKIR